MDVTGLADLDRVAADADLKRLYRYWAERRGGRAFPARGDIDPVEFSYALGRVSLIEVLESPRRYYYRLVSTQLTDHLGYEMTGKFVDEIPEPEMRSFAERQYLRAVERRAPLYQSDEVVLDGRRWRHETLELPLSADGRNVNMLMIYRATSEPAPVSPGGD